MTEPAAPDTSTPGNDYRKGLFAEPGSTFHGQVIGYQENNVQLPPVPPPMPLAEAQALLAELPLDHVPQPQTLPQPHRMRSWAPNKLFVGRDGDLGCVAAQLKAGGTIAVTTGIGGVGKTQLAIEAAHRYGRYFGGGVFWLSFADSTGIAAEIADCGRAMRAFHDAEQLDLDTQVQRTQALWSNDVPRLLIFDNCEDEALLRRWRPVSGGCRVLVTSRKQTAWTPDLRVTLLPLEVLARVASVQLLQQLAPRLTADEADQIAQELGDLPLALHLAGSYLAFYDDITAEQYLAKLRAINPLTHWSLQGDGVASMPTDREPHVARAFALSFERLNPGLPIDARARALLARAACFAPGEAFARDWLAATLEVKGDEEEQARARTGAIKRLLGLGLLEPVEKNVRLHRLVAAYTRLAVHDAGALPAVEGVVIEVAARANETRMPQTMLPVLPHLRHLVRQVERREDDAATTLDTNLGFYLNAVGAYGEALPLFERALAVSERVLGADHPDTALSLNNLALLLKAQGAYEAARPLYERALAIYERVLGADHPDTATSLNNLAGLLSAQGAYEAAGPLYERALAIRERVQGADHPDTALSLNNLAELHRAQGAYEAALPLYERALAIRERVQGADHPDTATSLNNLATLLSAQGAYGAALPLYERALAIAERVLGADHPDTATSLNNLAGLLSAQGAYEAAGPLYERALTIRERVLGADHPDTANSLNNWAGLLSAQGAYEAARPLLERALATRERVLGFEHPDTAESLNNLALLLSKQGAYEAARPLYERALAIYERVLGADHPDTATSLNNLAGLLFAQGAYGAARPLYERALAIYERVLGADHPDTARSLNNLAVLHANQRQFITALPLLEQALRIWQIGLGPQHPDTMRLQQSLAALHQRMVIAELPETVRTALEAGDGAAFQQALAALLPEEAQAIIQQLQAVGILADPLEQFTPLLQAIAAVALDDDEPRAEVEAALKQLEQRGYHLTTAVQAIWSGQRDPATLTAGLDDTDAALIGRVLALLEEGA